MLVLLAGVSAVALLSLSQDRLYRSEASLEIQGVNENFLNLRDIDPTAMPIGNSQDSYIRTQAEMLRQDALVERVVQELNLEERPEYQSRPDRWRKLRAVPGLAKVLDRIPVQKPQARFATEAAKKHLRIEPSGDTRIIRILFDAREPGVAADFANTLARTFIEQNVEQRRQGAQDIQEWLSPQLQAVRSKLDQSEAALDAYTRASGLMFTPGQQNLAEEKLKSVQTELSKAQAERINKEAQHTLAATNRPDTLVEEPAVRDYDMKLTDLRRQLAELDSIMQPSNYKVVRVQAQIVQLEAARQAEIQRLRKLMENDFKAAQARERDLNEAYARQSVIVSNLSNRMTHYNSLKHDVDTNRQFYEAMLQKINEAGIASAVRQSNIRLVGPAVPPLEPYSPNLPLNLAVGAFASLVLGVGVVLLQEQSNRRLRAPGDASLYLNLPELGTIPKFERLGSRSTKLLGSGNGGHPMEKIASDQKMSAWTESFRATIASILSADGNGGHPTVLVVTSSLPMEGKTTIASNLGTALAEISSRVLLIDGDLRGPRLHKVFDIANSWGLTDLLREKNAADELPLEAIVKKTAVPHLSLLPSGPCTEKIFSLLHSDRMERLLRRFRQEFDYVIVDAPPCLEFADARILGRYAEGVLLVVRANRTDRRAVMAAAQRLLMDGIPVLGTILNDWDPTHDGASHGYGYGYGYGYPSYHASDNRERS